MLNKCFRIPALALLLFIHLAVVPVLLTEGASAMLHQLRIAGPGAACSSLSLPAQGEGKQGRTCQEMSELNVVALLSRGQGLGLQKRRISPLCSRRGRQPAPGGCGVSWHVALVK